MTSKMLPMSQLSKALLLAGFASFPPTTPAVDYFLRAEPFTASMPGGVNVTMWGYASCTDGTFTSCGAATVPGPTLTVPVGDPLLTIQLKNNLPVSPLMNTNTSIVIPGQTATMVPVKFTDSSGRQRVRSFTHEALAGGGIATYSWTGMKPGTYLYHSGTHPQVQVQMGMYGGVKKDVGAGEIYPGVTYGNEVTLLYSEIDPALHATVAANAYDPTVTSTLNYQPKYFLINGKPFLAGDLPLATLTAGQKILLRFLNAGLQTHVPVIDGTTLRLVAEDGNPYPWPANPREQYSVLLPAGKTVDAILTPQAGQGGTANRYPIYDRRLSLSSGAAQDGGMLAFLDVAAGGNAPVINSGPVTIATQGVPYSYTVSATDVDGGTLNYSLDTYPAGMGINSVNGAITWTPSVQQVGTQAVTARVTDPTGLFATQAFSIAVADANDPPLAQNDAWSMIQNGTLNVAAPGVLANDSDPDVGNTLTAVNFSAASNGTLTPNANGDGGFSFSASTTGNKTFTYQARDNNNADSNVATVTISVIANRAPIAKDDTFSAPVRRLTPPYTAQVLAVLGNDSDPDTVIDPTNVINPATVTITAAPNKGGVVVVNANGTLTYTPKLNFRGTEVLKYRVRDNLNKLSNAATVRVNVQ